MELTSPSGGLWFLISVIGGFVLLGLFMLFARISNKRTETRESVNRTEAATHDLYKDQDAFDRAHDSAADREKI